MVRDIVDLAILRFGDLEIKNDVRHSSQMSFGKSWGGLLAKAVEGSAEHKSALLREFKDSDTFSPYSFKSTHYRDIFEVEGLAYEYWLANARLRAVGKGACLRYNKTRTQFKYDDDLVLEEAIRRHDKRLGSMTFFSTLIGVTFSPVAEDEGWQSLAMLQYNVSGQDTSSILKRFGLGLGSTGVTSNFIPVFLALKGLQESHSYLDDVFAEKWGFTFQDLTWVLWALSNMAFMPTKYFLKSQSSLGLI